VQWNGRTERSVASAGLAWGIVLLCLGSVPIPHGGPPLPGGLLASTPEGPALTLSPSAENLTPGNETFLEAAWTSAPPGCDLLPVWYAWAETGTPVPGVLNRSTGPVVAFDANTNLTGTAAITVRALVEEECGIGELAAYGSATTRLRVTAPLAIENLSAAPLPVVPGGPTNLTGVVTGGSPPYRIGVAWGDGSTSNASVGPAGTFRIAHAYAPGTYGPLVEAFDGAGAEAHAALGDPIAVSSGAALSLTASSSDPEVDRPLTVTLHEVAPPVRAIAFATCNYTAGAPPTLWLTSSTFDCTYAAPGRVTIAVTQSWNRTSELVAMLNETVAPALAVSGVPGTVDGALGETSVVPVNLSGGVAPIRLRLAPEDGAPAWNETAWTDGTIDLPLNSSWAGDAPIALSASDGAGASTPPIALAFDVAGPLNLSATVARAIGSNGTFVTVSASVVGGTGPFAWAVVPSASSNGSATFGGSLAATGTFGWSATFAEEGETSLTLLAVDAGGAVAGLALPVSLVPPLAVDLRLGDVLPQPNDTGAKVTLSAQFDGGLPPFSLVVDAETDAEWNLSADADGSFAWNLTVNATGPTNWSVAGTDALGVPFAWAGTLELPVDSNGSTGPSPSPSPSPAPGPAPAPSPAPASAASGSGSDGVGIAVLAALVALGAVGAFWWWRRRRTPTPTPAAPDPVAVLRKLIEPVDGADRPTIELLAEEEGVPLATVRETIDRLVADGTLRSETSPEGEEALSWANLPEP